MFSEWLWKRVTISVVKRSNVFQPHRPAVDDDAAHPVPVERRWPGLAGTPLLLADAVPRSERISGAQEFVLQTVLRLKEWFGLGASYPESFRSEKSPYYPEYVELHPASPLPEDFQPGKDRIAGVAWRGPFSLVTKKVGDAYEIDLSHVEGLKPRPGFLTVGGVAHLSRTASGLKTEWVQLDGKKHSPADADWALVERRFLAGLNSHTTFIEHLIFCHMSVAEHLALASIEALPSRHPLRAFLQPFTIETLRVNDDNIDGLIKTEHSNVPSYTGIPLSTLHAVIKAISSGFDLRKMDPVWRSTGQGTADFPTVKARIELFQLFRTLCDRYCKEVLKEVDAPTRAWCALLDKYVPNGVAKVAGITDWEKLTLEQVAHVLAVCTYTVSVTHHVVADTVRDYMMSFTIMPPSIAEDGYSTKGMVLEKMNSITVAGILRYRLMDDSSVVPEGAGRAIWAEFQSGLKAIQARVDASPADQRRYQVHPNKIPSSIHA